MGNDKTPTNSFFENGGFFLNSSVSKLLINENKKRAFLFWWLPARCQIADTHVDTETAPHYVNWSTTMAVAATNFPCPFTASLQTPPLLLLPLFQLPSHHYHCRFLLVVVAYLTAVSALTTTKVGPQMPVTCAFVTGLPTKPCRMMRIYKRQKMPVHDLVLPQQSRQREYIFPFYTNTSKAWRLSINDNKNRGPLFWVNCCATLTELCGILELETWDYNSSCCLPTRGSRRQKFAKKAWYKVLRKMKKYIQEGWTLYEAHTGGTHCNDRLYVLVLA